MKTLESCPQPYLTFRIGFSRDLKNIYFITYHKCKRYKKEDFIIKRWITSQKTVSINKNNLLEN